MKEFQFYQFDELCGNILTNIMNHVSNDPLPWLKRLIRQFIYDDHNTAKESGIVCPEWNEETLERILGASYDAVVKLIQRPWKQTISDCLFNGIVESFEIDHIMPKMAFSTNLQGPGIIGKSWGFITCPIFNYSLSQ